MPDGANRHLALSRGLDGAFNILGTRPADFTDGLAHTLKIVCFMSPEHRKAGRPLWAWEADKLEPLGGRHVVTQSTWSRFVVNDAGPDAAPKVDYSQRHKIDLCEFDVDIARSTFWPVFPPGVRVADAVKHQSYRVPGGVTATVASNPIRVVDSSGGWWGVAGAVTFLALVFVAVLIRRRLS